VLTVAKKSAAKSGSDGSVPLYHATVAYKQWLRVAYKKKYGSLDALADAMQRVDRTISATSGGLSQLLGRADEPEVPSNTHLMPAINKAMGIAPPTICDPEDPLSQLKDRIDSLWRAMTKDERERFLKAMEATLGLVSPIESR
jgi:hypothetical protein